MAGYTSDELRAMVQADRVHRAIYTDPAIFEIEMEKIFRRVWLYVGHESLVPNAGDYYCTHLARQPVVLSRHAEDGICVLFNRCGHRGVKVLNRERGNARVFTCMYHGWSFRPNGTLAGVPMRRDFPEDPQFDMAALPRVESYRGFVFASFDPHAEPLLDYLAEARRGIDELVDRSPAGEVALSAGCHRYHYRGNWKLQLENLADMYHPAACHASTVGPDGRHSSAAPAPRAATPRSSPPTARRSSRRPACAASTTATAPGSRSLIASSRAGTGTTIAPSWCSATARSAPPTSSGTAATA